MLGLAKLLIGRVHEKGNVVGGRPQSLAKDDLPKVFRRVCIRPFTGYVTEVETKKRLKVF